MFTPIKIGRPFGIDLSVHGTFWLLPAFVLLSGISSRGPAAAVLDVFVLLAVFGCVALHELGHALAARGFGIRTRDITLYPIGGVARLERMPEKPWQEIAVALAGPAVNVAIVLFLAPLMLIDGYPLAPTGPFDSALEVFWNRLLWGNVVLVLFNLIPAFPMDGGRVLRATAAAVTDRVTATRFAAGVGAAFAVLFAVLSVVNADLWLLVIAYFLFATGRAELAAVRQAEAFRPRDGWEFDYRRQVWVLHGR